MSDYKECTCGYNSGFEGCTYSCYPDEPNEDIKKEGPG